MSEPTKAQGDEMEDLARQFAKNYSWQFVLPPSALFKLVAEIRAQATNDERERCARICDEWQLAGNAATAIRAMKEPTQ